MMSQPRGMLAKFKGMFDLEHKYKDERNRRIF